MRDNARKDAGPTRASVCVHLMSLLCHAGRVRWNVDLRMLCYDETLVLTSRLVRARPREAPLGTD